MSDDPPGPNTTELYTVRIDHDRSEPVVSAVVSGVAACTGRGVTGLPPLYNVVDSEALTRVFTSPLGSRRRSNDERIVFTYAGCEVVIDGGDELTARLLEDRQEGE